MTTTTFVDKTTVVEADWLNDVNTTVYGTVPTIFPTLAASTGSSLVGHIASGTGAVARTAQGKMRDIVSTFDFMTAAQIADVQAGTLAQDVTAAVQAALNTAKRIYAPAGSYLIGQVTIPSNTDLRGAGKELTIFKTKNATNAPTFINSDTAGGNSNITLMDFRVNGNSTNQAPGNCDGIRLNKSDNNLIERVHLDDFIDWSFGMWRGVGFTLRDCLASGMIGINSGSGVRAGYLFGSSGLAFSADSVTVDNCEASGCTAPFVDGFIFDLGSGLVVTNSRALFVPFSGFKVHSYSNGRLMGNQAKQCLIGYQQQSNCFNMQYIGNNATENAGAGFEIGNNVPGSASQVVVIHDNVSVNNGQNQYQALYGSPSGNRYGIDVQMTAGCTIDVMSIQGNTCVDTGGGTQTRGISFNDGGTCSHVHLGPNTCQGNTLDLNQGTSLQLSTLTRGWNVGFNGTSYTLEYPTSVREYEFWFDNIGATSNQFMLDGAGERGHVVTHAGYIRSLTAKSNAPITADNATFQLQINGSIDSTFNTQLNTTNPSLKTTNDNMQSRTVAVGDMIRVSVVGGGGLLPNGSADLNAVVEIVY